MPRPRREGKPVIMRSFEDITERLKTCVFYEENKPTYLVVEDLLNFLDFVQKDRGHKKLVEEFKDFS